MEPKPPSGSGSPAPKPPQTPEEKQARLRELQRQRAEAAAQRKLDEGIKEAEARGKLKELPEADRKWLEADPRRKQLAYDPDTKSFKVREAKAALQAEADGVLKSPVKRAIDETGSSRGGDFIDGNGKYWDFKDASASVDRIVEAAKRGENIVVDATGLSPSAQKAIENAINGKLGGAKGTVLFVPKR